MRATGGLVCSSQRYGILPCVVSSSLGLYRVVSLSLACTNTPFLLCCVDRWCRRVSSSTHLSRVRAPCVVLFVSQLVACLLLSLARANAMLFQSHLSTCAFQPVGCWYVCGAVISCFHHIHHNESGVKSTTTSEPRVPSSTSTSNFHPHRNPIPLFTNYLLS